MKRTQLLWLPAALALASALGARAESLPAVTRPSLQLEERTESGGVVFFIPARSPSGAAGVGTAHTFEISSLVKAIRVTFALGHSGQNVAVSTGLLAPPGKPFNAPGASHADDFVVYALQAAPKGVRVLDPEPRPPKVGTRVKVIGIPARGPANEDAAFGKVSQSSRDLIEVILDMPHNLRGWGGAPVVTVDRERVVGILEAYYPQDKEPRVSVAPIAGVLAAIKEPLDRGAGRAFARFAPQVATQTATPRPPPAAQPSRAPPAPQRQEPLFPAFKSDETQVNLSIDYPRDGAVVRESACGTFVAGRALALEGELRRFDVVLVIDTSRSTIDPAGSDINGNGVVGRPRLGRVGSIFGSGSSDPGDSILAAEVAAARHLLRGLDPRSTRVALVAFSGDPGDGGGLFSRGPRPAAMTLEALTNQYSRIERSLDSILAHEPAGATHMAAGLDQATIELMGLRGSLSRPDPDAEKVVLFFTDGQPTLPYGPSFEADNVRAVLRAANRADRAEIRVHSFAIGPDALDGPIATVEMANRTDGFFTPVRNPGDLIDVVEQVSFANLAEIVVKSLTTDTVAEPFRSTADGGWAGLVKSQPGRNTIRATASAADGTSAKRDVHVIVSGEAPEEVIPPELVVLRNRLLEECLRLLKEVRLQAERDQAEKVRRELMVEIERERAKAAERADQQRKRLEIGVDPDDVSE